MSQSKERPDWPAVTGLFVGLIMAGLLDLTNDKDLHPFDYVINVIIFIALFSLISWVINKFRKRSSSAQLTIPDAESRSSEPTVKASEPIRNFCSACGVNVESDDAFCLSCGKKL